MMMKLSGRGDEGGALVLAFGITSCRRLVAPSRACTMVDCAQIAHEILATMLSIINRIELK